LKEFKEINEQIAAQIAEQSASVAQEIIEFLKDSGAPLPVGIFAAGMAFASGARVLGMSLPTTIDLVRILYKQEQENDEADK